MDKIQTVISLSGSVIVLLMTILTFFLKFLKSSKARNIAETVLKIGDSLLPYIKEAELFTNFSGDEKKAYVLTRANQYAIDTGLKFDISAVSAKIEEIIEITNVVNVKKKEIL